MKSVEEIQLKQFIDSYIECMLWASTDLDGNDFDDYRLTDFSSCALTRIEKDCIVFVASNKDLIDQYVSYDQAGHDFFLTRNGHGTGFWDCEEVDTAVKDELVKASKKFPESNLISGDDGKLYVY